MRFLVIAGLASYASATQIEVVSSNLNGGGRVVDNIKAKWQSTLTFLGNEARLEAEYDRNKRERALSEATLTGKNGDVNYELKTTFDGDAELTASTNTKDGTTVEVVANNRDGVQKVSAERPWNIQGQDCTVGAEHAPSSSESKLKLSSVLGHGVKALASYTVGNSGNKVDYELEYEADISEGRHVSANLKPQDNSGEIEYVDTKTLDATLTASMDIGGKPKVTVKRAWDF